VPFRVRDFLTATCGRVTGAAADELARAAEAYAALTTARQKARCIREMMNVLEAEVDEPTRREIMETCGRGCIGPTTLQRACRLQRQARDLDDLLARFNAAHIGGGHLRREGDVIRAAYERCYCAAVAKTQEPFSPTFCQCSCGWYRQLFETVLGRPAEVRLVGSVIQGDDRCRFLIRLGGQANAGPQRWRPPSARNLLRQQRSESETARLLPPQCSTEGGVPYYRITANGHDRRALPVVNRT
jgi:hypothetical protein